ncbi:YfbM family protein [Pedosphaera parvula]|uniref:DUF1877 domain-containing protein n=1 Tax=Pedosphaera parvula (strain Ellin514) TaxID=320771 RepID=B9XHV1_PEDPL|nr:YfbM family protein [Pedosphaera parvula]EEF60679.1 protein of unknown function DUF1877 [Pedosphaera parvula Ellin514]
MSIEAGYWRVTPEEFKGLLSDPKAAGSFFGNDLESLDDPEALLVAIEEREASGRHLSVGTDWHALHFLLTGEGDIWKKIAPPPLGNVVQGGKETPWECTYGHVRSLTPDEVREVAQALEGISVEELRSRFNVESFNAAQIYPHGRRGAWTVEDVESVFDFYPLLVLFFQEAAKAGEMVLLSSD